MMVRERERDTYREKEKNEEERERVSDQDIFFHWILYGDSLQDSTPSIMLRL